MKGFAIMNYHSLWPARRILGVFLPVVGAFCAPAHSQTGATKPLDDPKAVLNNVLSAIQNVALVPSGRGTAIMTADARWPERAEEPAIMDFVFKGQMSRFDRFVSVKGKKGARLHARVITERRQFGINPQYGSVRPALHTLHYAVGADFHPQVFMHLGGMGINDIFKLMASPDNTLSADMDSNDVIHLVARCQGDSRDGPYDHTLRVSVDTRRAFLPVLLAMEIDYHKQPARSQREMVQCDWVKWGSGWYVRSADYRFYAIGFPDQGDYERFEVTQFDPNAQISDDEFTLQGLGIKDGMTVVDAVAGVSYRYRMPVHEVSELEEVVEQAAFTEETQAQSAASVDKEPNQSGEPGPLGQAAPQGPARIGVLLGVLLLVTVVAAYAGYRRALARASHGGKA